MSYHKGGRIKYCLNTVKFFFLSLNIDIRELLWPQFTKTGVTSLTQNHDTVRLSSHKNSIVIKHNRSVIEAILHHFITPRFSIAAHV